MEYAKNTRGIHPSDTKFRGFFMLTLTCPCCGVAADETELHADGEAHIKRFGPGSEDADFEGYLFYRDNPRGVAFERWRHVMGCGKWFHMARSTVTLEVFGVYAADVTSPPPEVLAQIDAAKDAGRVK